MSRRYDDGSHPYEARSSHPFTSSTSNTWSSGAFTFFSYAIASAHATSTFCALKVWLKYMTPLAVLGMLRIVRLVSLAQKLKTTRSRSPFGQLPGWKSSGNLWNSRSESRKTTGSCVVRNWLRMKAGLMAIALNRNSSEPSGASGPKTFGGSTVALQQQPTRSHELISRLALSLYLGEYMLMPTNSFTLLWQMRLMRMSPRVKLCVNASWWFMLLCA